MNTDKKISQLNDIAVLYFKEPVKRIRYIQIGIVNAKIDKIMIPKISGNKIEHCIEERPILDPKRERIISYNIKT